MSNNPFMDYQEQFFKMWKDNMGKMVDSDAYKAMTKNIPGADAYAKAMESMIPNVENYWKNMMSSMPQMPGMNFWNSNPWNSNPWSSNPWNSMMASNPFMDYWKNMADKMPDMSAFWTNPQNFMPNMIDYWKSVTSSIPGMDKWWDSFSKMVPNPEMFTKFTSYQLPGFEAYGKVFDLWKSFGDSGAMVSDFQKKYMDTLADILKGYFPAAVQPFISRPTDFLNMMVDYYKQFVSPWMTIEPEILERIAQGDTDAYIDFFKDYQVKYEEELEKYFTVMGFGINREANADYMNYVNEGNKALISMGELLAVVTKTAQESFADIADKVQKDLAAGKSITTFRDFYNVWYSVTEKAYESLLMTDAFAKSFCGFADRYAKFMVAQNKVLERMLSSLPIPTNTDMKSLYKTVYDLRKEVRDLKKALAAMEEKKGVE